MIYFLETGDRCYSPSGSYGICVVLPQCPSLIYYYGQSQGNRQVINYLLATQRNCGNRRIGNNPIVCCDNPVINPTQSPYQPQPQPQPVTTQSPYQPQPEFPPEEPVPQPPVTQRPTQPPTTRWTTPQTTTVAPTSETDSRAAGKSCNDPNGEPGTCTNIKECPSVLNKFIESSSDPRYIRFIKISNSICDNIQPYICCPYEKTNGETSTSETILPNEPVETVEPIKHNESPNGNSIQGRLLTPEEGCGYSYNTSTRIVNGKPAKLG